MVTDRGSDSSRRSPGHNGRHPDVVPARTSAGGRGRKAAPAGLSRLSARAEHAESRSRRWLAASALLLAFGLVASLFGALTVARNESHQSQQAFIASAREISSTFKLAIQHEQDLVAGAGSFVVLNPNASQAEFGRWSKSVGAFERYPELVGIAELTMVPASQLSAFAAHATADPAGPLAADGTFQVTPAGSRPYYCFATVSLSRTGQSTTPAGFDFCATGLGPALLQARDTGLAAYLPYSTGKDSELVLGTPVYRDGITPNTVQARRDAFLGWTGTSIVPDVVLDTAMEHYPSMAMDVVYGNGPSKVTFTNGSAPAGAQTTTTNLHNGWHVVAYGPVNDGGVFDNWNAIALLFGGIALFLLLASTIFLLGTGRSRAMLLVQERTEQLRHQAFHDALTGLPNRALILDRMDQMLARSRRDSTPVAVLFLDLDNFKDINDTLGHDAGDQLLVAVASRLAHALRESDTVGRLGGDEFVVLAEGSSLAAGAEAVAERLRSALGAPIPISSGPSLTVTASIGIATDRAHHSRGTPSRCRHCAVPGEGRRKELCHSLFSDNATSRGRSPISRCGPPSCFGRRRVLLALPANRRSPNGQHQRRRSPVALAPSRTRHRRAG